MSMLHIQFQSILSSYYPSKPTTYYHHFPLNPLPLKLTNTKLRETKRAVTLLVVQAASSSSRSIQKSDESQPLISGSEVVKKFYEGINLHDLGAVHNLIAQDCVYEDLIFPAPFLGRKVYVITYKARVLGNRLEIRKAELKVTPQTLTADTCTRSILEFFGKFTDYVSTDLQFVIDAISEEDSSAVGVTWHLEWKGKAFPFSKGCSFYQLTIENGSRQIIYARDSVEPAIKPGESALVAIRGVTWLLQRFPNLADKL